MANLLSRPAILFLAALAVILVMAALAGAQDPAPQTDEAAEGTAGVETEESASRRGQQDWSQLGADMGSACICRCTHEVNPDLFEFGYFERSLMTGCNWNGRICVLGGQIGRLSRCTPAPAPALR